MRILLLVGLLATLISCGRRDYSKPHEYLKAVGYGEGWATTEGNHYKFRLTQIKLYSELGAGKCEKYLANLDPEDVYLEMASTNFLIRSEFEGRNDAQIMYAKLQCIAFHGQDQACEAKRMETAKNVDANASRHDAGVFVLKTLGDCDIRREIGPVRTFSLGDSKRFKYVAK